MNTILKFWLYGAIGFYFLFSLSCNTDPLPNKSNSQQSYKSTCLSINNRTASQRTGIKNFLDLKVQIADRYLKSSSKGMVSKFLSPSSYNIKDKTPLAIMINHNCLTLFKFESLSSRVIKSSAMKPVTPIQVYAISVKGSLNFAQLKEEADRDPCVLGISDNEETKLDLTQSEDPKRSEQAEYFDPIRAEEAWKITSHPISGIKETIVLAVLDTGVEYTHEDLKNQMWDYNGTHGYDTANNDNNPMDDHGHGTMVTGLIAAEADNGLGIKGIISGDPIEIMAIKVLKADGSGNASTVANGILWATYHGADIINLSLGGPGTAGGPGSVVTAAIDYALKKNILFINAAGNNGYDIITNPFWPANNGDKPGFIVTAATTAPDKTIARFSNHNRILVHIAAPGASANNKNGIISTGLNNSYVRSRGTSFAAPIVSGSTALILSLIKTRKDLYTNQYIESLLMASADKLPGLDSYVKGGNYLNLWEFAKMASDRTTALILKHPEDQHLLIKEPLNLSIQVTGENANYQWYKNDQPIKNANKPIYHVPSVTMENEGTYFVVIRQAANYRKTISASAKVKVYQSLCHNE